jgi:hypothetical protein
MSFFDFLKLDSSKDFSADNFDFASLAKILGTGAVAGQSLGLFGDRQPDIGYQGTIPKYKAVRRRVPNVFDADRRPGSGGRRYFTDTTYVDMDADTAQQDLVDAISAAETQATALSTANTDNPAREVQPVRPIVEEQDPVVADEPASFLEVPTAESVLSQNMSPSEETSPFTSPYQYIEDDPNSPLQVTPYSEGGLVELVEALRSAPELLAYLGAATGLGGLGSYAINRGMSAYRDAEAEKIKRMTDPKNFKKTGGIAELGTRKQRYLDGETDGMADEVPATIDNEDPAALSDGEYVIPADVVSHLGNGNSDAGAKVLDEMLARVRKARTGETEQAPEINPKEFLPA